ncbi:MAG: hypothetical protein Fur0010_15740 [Bdellovibrio sp.]
MQNEASYTRLKGTDMKTLTRFINANFRDTTHTQTHLEDSVESGIYEVIENEHLEDQTFVDLGLSGSLLTYTTFKNVTFKSCVFFGSKIENCTFINCKFIDCEFNFSHMHYCDFRSSTFVNTKWDFSPLNKSSFSYCALDTYTAYFAEKDENVMTSCFSSELSEAQTEQKTEQNFFNGLMNYFKQKEA